MPNKGVPASAEAEEGRALTKRNANKEAAARTQSRDTASYGLEGVRERAKTDESCQFTALLHHITPELLKRSFYELNRKAAAGIDGVTWEMYEKQLEERLPILHEEIHKGSYRAKPVLRTYIPKSDGSKRPLGITRIEDKLVQQAVSTVLLAIYEEDFIGFSYGFRRNRNQHHALDALVAGIVSRNINWILDADIKGFFDSIPHDRLLELMGKRIGDKRIMRLIRKWLKTGYIEEGKVQRQTIGTPQGSVISPLLANIYLHYVLDKWLNAKRQREAEGDIIIVRYADDFVMGFQHRSEAERYLEALRARFSQYGLTLHPEKTRIIEFGRYAAENRKRRGEKKPETFNFLGFTHICSKSSRGRYWVKRKTNQKSFRRKLREVTETLRKQKHSPIHETGKWLGTVVRGFGNYFGVPGNSKTLGKFRTQCVRIWMKNLRRRSHKGRNFSWERLSQIADIYIPHLRICHEYPEDRFFRHYSR